MNEQQQALLDALGGARLPGGTIAWPAVVLAFVMVAALLALCAMGWRRRLRRRQARAAAQAWLPEARDAVESLQARKVVLCNGGSVEQQRDWMADAARLARRIALVSEARSDIAALHGDSWLQRLDALVGQPVFSVAPVNALASVPYRAAADVPAATLHATGEALQTLLAAVERRRRHAHRGGTGNARG